MVDPNRVLFESVVRLLAPVLDKLVFVGGCTTGLFITDPAASGIRLTKDVDAIVDVTSYAKYSALSERLRTLGLVEDTTPGAPLCRWRRNDLIIDVIADGRHCARLQQPVVPGRDRNGADVPHRRSQRASRYAGSVHRHQAGGVSRTRRRRRCREP